MPKIIQKFRFMIYQCCWTLFCHMKLFFSADSCSLGLTLQNTRGCPVSTLEHFQILTPSCPKSHKKWDLWYFSMPLNLVLSYEAFFFAVSCSLGCLFKIQEGARWVPLSIFLYPINPFLPQITQKWRFMICQCCWTLFCLMKLFSLQFIVTWGVTFSKYKRLPCDYP